MTESESEWHVFNSRRCVFTLQHLSSGRRPALQPPVHLYTSAVKRIRQTVQQNILGAVLAVSPDMTTS